MTDYDKSVGTAGIMRIRDEGGNVEFWLYTSSTGTWWGSLTFTYSSPNGSGSFAVGWDTGGGWRKVKEINVSDSGTVSWTMPYTGTSAFGGPNTQSVSLNRATVPPSPTPVTFEDISHTSVVTKFSSRGDGGSTTLEWQISFGTSSSGPTASANDIYTSSGTKTFSGLIPGQYYAAWARGRNAEGWGAWSAGRSFYTLPGMRVRVAGAWKIAIPYVRVSGSWKPAVPYGRSAGAWKLGD